MKRTPRLLFFAVTIFLTLACLGESETAKPTVSVSVTHTPTETAAPTATPYVPKLGITVAYILDGNVWLWEASAPARQITTDGDAWRVILSDDGKVIVYERNPVMKYGPGPAQEFGTSLWAVNANGASPRELITITSLVGAAVPLRGGEMTLYFDQIEFQPGTHWLYFNTYWSGNQGIIAANDLHRIDVDTPALQTLLSSGGGKFNFSPNAELLTLSSITDIKIIHADGSGLVTALSYPIIDNLTDYKPKTVWMKDSAGFYTVLPSDEKSRFMYVAADGSVSAQLAEFSAVWIDVVNPVISPDGTKVAYIVNTATSCDLRVVDAAAVDTLIASYEGAPYLELLGWSPDSKLVIHWNSYPGFLKTVGIGISPALLTEFISPYSLRWIDTEHFIFYREGKLLIGQMGSPEVFQIAPGFQTQYEFTHSYDFTVIPPP